MMLFPFFLPLAEIAFLTPPPGSNGTIESMLSQPVILAALLVAALVAVIGLWRSLKPSPARKPDMSKHWVVVDGSNVMHWKDEAPQIATVQAVVAMLKSRGFAPGVVFDANAGYKLSGRYMNEREFSMLLALPENQIFVVPKGTQADPYLLGAARDFGARVVTRDRFRDWADAHPEVKKPGFLIRGGYRNSGDLWLDEASPVVAEPVA